ncbi:MAG: hypothetical protein IKB65_04320 [Ruminiclostridium sp.]|nr:hypothetical protein [Ruminiclostridium sp.]
MIDAQTDTIKTLQEAMEKTSLLAEERAEQASEKDDKITKLNNAQEKQREKVCRFAEKKVEPLIILWWNIVPFCILLYFLFVIGFIALQILWCWHY